MVPIILPDWLPIIHNSYNVFFLREAFSDQPEVGLEPLYITSTCFYLYYPFIQQVFIEYYAIITLYAGVIEVNKAKILAHLNLYFNGGTMNNCI